MKHILISDLVEEKFGNLTVQDIFSLTSELLERQKENITLAQIFEAEKIFRNIDDILFKLRLCQSANKDVVCANLPDYVLELIPDKKMMVSAVKAIRKLLGCGLKEAKEIYNHCFAEYQYNDSKTWIRDLKIRQDTFKFTKPEEENGHS